MSYLSDFEHTKLDAHAFPGMVVETHSISDASAGKRRVLQARIWKVERLLGKGGFGEVRLETHEGGQRAVKRIWATGATFKVEYERELKALLEFSKPKYKESAVFVEFLGWFQDVESVYLAMEYVPLGDLEDNVVKLGGKIGEGEVKEITVQILEGLKIMHLESFVHRDLKPKNVLVCRASPNWWVKLADFGLSKRRTEDTAFRTQTGTQAYMAPEILNYIPGHSEYTYAVDIWALGCIMYRLITGTVPFPPGLSLTSFCGDESRFPSQALYMSDSGKDFIRKVIVAHPSRRLTSGEALEHEWTRPDSKIPDESIGQLIAPNDHTTKDTSESFGGYNTDTHAGLQSHGNRSTTVATPAVHLTAPPKPLPSKYQQPTVEDEPEPENIGEDSAHEAGTQVLPTKDGGIHGALPGQDEDLVDQDHTINPTNRKGKKGNSDRSCRNLRMPVQSVEILDESDYDEEIRQHQAGVLPRKSSNEPHEPPETKGTDVNEWAFLRGTKHQEDDRLSSGYHSNSGGDLDSATDISGGGDSTRWSRERTYVTSKKQAPTRYIAPPGSGPHPRRVPEPTRYVIENGRTVPLTDRIIPARSQWTSYIGETNPRYIDESVRTIPVRPDSEEFRNPWHQHFIGLVPRPPLTANNLRMHNSQIEPRRKPPPTFGMSSEFSFETHSIHTSTRAIPGGRKIRRPRSLRRRRSAEYASDRQSERPSFYADEHGFVERARSPALKVRQQEGSIYDRNMAEAARYMEEHPQAERKDSRSRQRNPNLFSIYDMVDEPMVRSTGLKMTARPSSRAGGGGAYFDEVLYEPKYTPENVIHGAYAAGFRDFERRRRDTDGEDDAEYKLRPVYA